MCEERGIIIKKRRIRGCEDVEFRVGAGNMCNNEEETRKNNIRISVDVRRAVNFALSSDVKFLSPALERATCVKRGNKIKE